MITTLGEEGSVLIDEKGIKSFNAVAVDAINTTAAGDSFIGAVAFKLSQGMDIEEAISFATIVSALTVTKEGAQESIPSSHELLGFMEE